MKFVSKIALLALTCSALALPSASTHASHVRTSNNISVEQPVSQNQNKQVHNKGMQDPHFHHVFKVAKSKLGDSYRWGATGSHTFDCSGFTQYIYKHGAHKLLPRTAGAQKNYCHHVNRKHTKPGDLVFFGASRRSIQHVGMCIGHGKMIDAQNRGVVIESIKAPWWHVVGYGRP